MDYSRQANYLLRAAQDSQEATAVLYRNNDSALPLLDLLEREGVPYVCRQKESFFFTSPVVRDLTDMLSFSYDSCDRKAFLRFYYKLDLKLRKNILIDLLRFQGEGETVFETLLRSGQLEPWQVGRVKAMQTHFSKLPQLSSFVALQRIVRYMGYGDYMKEQKLDPFRLDILLALANQTREVGAFLARLRALREIVAQGGKGTGTCITLSTIHASKGLEYDRVFLIDVVDGIFPAVREEGMLPEEQETLEEERRLFYVGATRARKQLELLSYREKFGAPREAGICFIHQLLGERSRPGVEEIARRLPAQAAAAPTAEQVALWEQDYLPGVEVIHKTFGRGLLRERMGNIATISFRETGVKRLDLITCLKRKQIELAHVLPDRG